MLSSSSSSSSPGHSCRSSCYRSACCRCRFSCSTSWSSPSYSTLSNSCGTMVRILLAPSLSSPSFPSPPPLPPLANPPCNSLSSYCCGSCVSQHLAPFASNSLKSQSHAYSRTLSSARTLSKGLARVDSISRSWDWRSLRVGVGCDVVGGGGCCGGSGEFLGLGGGTKVRRMGTERDLGATQQKYH